MADDKIRISWDEISRPEVDQKVSQQELLGRAQQHYAQGGGTFAPGLQVRPHAVTQPASTPSFFYNSLVYMAMFGLFGGGVAWVAGEVVDVVLPNPFEEFVHFAQQSDAIDQRLARGEIHGAEAARQRQKLHAQYRDNPYTQILLDETLSEQEKLDEVASRQAVDGVRMFVQQLIWFSVLAMCIALSLAVADHVMSRNWSAAIVNGAVGVCLGLLGGIIVGLFINSLYRAMAGDGMDGITPRQVFARSIGWAILGMFLSIAPGVVMRNAKRLFIGLAGGFIGGLVGGLLFDVVATTTNDVLSRMIAITAIGVISGLGTGLIELAAKSGWLKVVGGLIAGKQFVLYKNPTYLGSSPQCEIYLFKDPQVAPQHAALHQVPGGFDLEDLRSHTGTLVNGRAVSRVRLRNNDLIQIGGSTLQFQEKPKT